MSVGCDLEIDHHLRSIELISSKQNNNKEQTKLLNDLIKDIQPRPSSVGWFRVPKELNPKNLKDCSIRSSQGQRRFSVLGGFLESCTGQRIMMEGKFGVGGYAEVMVHRIFDWIMFRCERFVVLYNSSPQVPDKSK